jgi:hypothetical protein
MPFLSEILLLFYLFAFCQTEDVYTLKQSNMILSAQIWQLS